MYKKRGIFHRVRRHALLLPQLVQYFSEVAHQDHSSVSFVYNGLRISQNHTAVKLSMEDGDVIDGFNFHTMSKLNFDFMQLSFRRLFYAVSHRTGPLNIFCSLSVSI